MSTDFIELLKGRDRASFGQLYDAYSPALYGITLRMMNSQELAEDVLQEAFIKIWNNLTNYDTTKGTIFTWMLNITRNTAIDALRSRKAKATTSFNEDVKALLERDHSLEINTNIIGVKELIAQLRPEYQEAIQAVYFTGMTHDEAATELNLPLGTLKTRIRGALTELKRIFALLTWLFLNT